MSSPVSIVVPAYGRADLLRRHLPPLLAELARHPAGGEVLVVDDASPEPLGAMLASAFPTVRCLTRAVNGGFAVAATAGLRAAAHELVLLLNSDVRVRPGCLAPLVRELETPTVFAATPRVLLAGDEDRIESFVRLERDAGRVVLRQPGLTDRAAVPREPVDVDFPLGGAMLVWRERFDELGGFDARFAPFYLEDADLGRRATRAGWRTRYVPASVVEHHHRGTIGRQVGPRCIRAAIERNRWMLARNDDRAAGTHAWLPAAFEALVSAARSGSLRDEATWLATLGDRSESEWIG